MTAAAKAYSGKLIVVLSSERSGSTMLRVMLGENPRIVAPQELFLLRYKDYDAWRAQKDVAAESLLELFALLGCAKTQDEIDRACRGRSTPEVYAWILAHLPAESLLVDKTPAYANEPGSLRRAEELEPFYIWIIRHPLGVVDSHVRIKERERKQRRRNRYPFGVAEVLGACERLAERARGGMTALARFREHKWVIQNRNARDFLAGIPAERQLTLRFEDLVTAPESHLRALCRAVGLTFDPAMLHFAAKRKTMNPWLGDPNFHTHDRVDPTPALGWRERFAENRLEPATRELMQQLGVPSVVDVEKRVAAALAAGASATR